MTTQVGTGIAPENLQEHLESASNAAAKGQGSFHTPERLAQIAAKLLPLVRPVICDLNCGASSLLNAAANSSTRTLLGVDIQNCRTPASKTEKVIADVTRLFPLFHEIKWKADLFTLNPPFDLHFYRDRLNDLAESELASVRSAFREVDPRLGPETIDSTVAMMMIALHCMTEGGEGYIIANDATLNRLIFGLDAPYRALAGYVWARFVLKGNPMTGDDGDAWNDTFHTGLIYFARSHRDGYFGSTLPLSNLDELDEAVTTFNRIRYRRGFYIDAPHQCNHATHSLFLAAREEWKTRTNQVRPVYNIWLDSDGKIKTYLSTFESNSSKVNKDEANRLFKLNGERPMQLVMQAQQRYELQRAVKGTMWKVHPSLPKFVEEAVRAYHGVRAPLRQLSPVQSLGYLDEQDSIVCSADLVGPTPMPDHVSKHFRAFQNKPCNSTWDALAHQVVNGVTVWRALLKQDPDFEFEKERGAIWKIVPKVDLVERAIRAALPAPTGKPSFLAGRSYKIRTQTVAVQRTKMRPSLTFGEEEFELNGQELVIYITDESGQERAFIDARHKGTDIKVETEAAIDFALQDLVEHFDIPVVPDVAECNPDLYKSYLSKLKDIERFLPKCFRLFQMEDLARSAMHDGAILAWDTGLGKGWSLIVWPLLKAGCAADRLAPLKPVLVVAPGHLHGQIAAEAWNCFKVKLTPLDSQETFHNLQPLTPGFYISSFTQLATNKVQRLPNPKDVSADHVQGVAELMDFYGFTTDDALKQQRCSIVPKTLFEHALSLCVARFKEFSEGVETEKNGIRCVYSPSLADLCRHSFDTVVIDEATKIKGEETLVGKGVRLLDPPHRLILTATPVKNRLPDIFWLAWWASGGKAEPHARFPYSSEPGEMEKFSAEFLVTERNLTQERLKNGGTLPVKKTGSKRRRGKITSEVCNIHRLWKLLGPILLRRRKSDIGEEIVQKIKQPIRVPMGSRQMKTYAYHLSAPYTDKEGKPATCAKLTALRTVAAAPHSDALQPQGAGDIRAAIEALEKGSDVSHRSQSDYTPKVAACLNLVKSIMERGEQVVIFSAFIEPLDTISRRLAEAGVPHDVLDGRKNERIRGDLAGKFKLGLPNAKPVLLAGLNAMAEGHSWDLCNNCILLAFDWAWNLFEQAINRVHRLNSLKNVNVYPIIVQGTIDRKLESMIDEKGNASELVLDGQLLGENIEEVNLAELLQVAYDEFNPECTIDEETLESEWPMLRQSLRAAYFDLTQKIKEEKPLTIATPPASPQLLQRSVQTPVNLVKPVNVTKPPLAFFRL